MGSQIIRQTKTDLRIDGNAIEEGKLAVFSSVEGDIVLYNATREEVLDFFADDAATRARHAAEQKLAVIDTGHPAYYQFTKTFEIALKEALRTRGLAKAASAASGPDEETDGLPGGRA